MKKSLILVSLMLVVLSGEGCAAQNNQQVDYDQVKREYRLYMEKLKELSEQYKGITQQITTVMKEEGVPAFDEKTGTLTTQPYRESVTQITDARIQETDKEMTVSVDLPGLKRDTIQIKITDRQQIRIVAHKKDDKNDAPPMEKIIVLPVLVNEEGPKASYEDGVLTVRMRKSDKKDISVPLSK